MEVDFPKFSKLPLANFLVDPARFRDQDLKTFRPEEVLNIAIKKLKYVVIRAKPALFARINKTLIPLLS